MEADHNVQEESDMTTGTHLIGVTDLTNYKEGDDVAYTEQGEEGIGAAYNNEDGYKYWEGSFSLPGTEDFLL
jgi:hypothetical protein